MIILIENQTVIVYGKEVNVSELPNGSNKRVFVTCDYCGKQYDMMYKKYIQGVINGTVHKCACKDCEKFKIKESNLLNYGTSSTNRLESVKQKKVHSYTEKYGCKNPMKFDEIKKKFRSTIHEKYPPNSEERKAVERKRKETMMRKYGVAHPSFSPVLLQKRSINNLKKYGVRHTLALESVREQIANTKYKNGTGGASVEQERICNLLGGVLNFPVGKYLVDIKINNIVVEYDGSGHCLSVLYGLMSEHDFHNKEKMREDFIISKGYKIIRIKHIEGTEISDDEYIRIYYYCLEMLKDKSIVVYDVDKNCLV